MRPIMMAAATAAILVSGAAQAASYTATQDAFCVSAPGFCTGTTPITLTLDVPTVTAGDAIVTIEAFGDFDSPEEAFSVSVDGFSFGNFLNTNEADDLFSGVAGDFGDQYSDYGRGAAVGTAIIGGTTFASLISDGQLVFTFTPLSVQINDLSNAVEEYLRVSVAFDAPAAVPLPASAAFLLFGIAGLGVLRRRP